MLALAYTGVHILVAGDIFQESSKEVIVKQHHRAQRTKDVAFWFTGENVIID